MGAAVWRSAVADAVTTHYCNDSCTAEWLREIRALEAEQDQEAVACLPYLKVRAYPCKDELLGFADDQIHE